MPAPIQVGLAYVRCALTVTVACWPAAAPAQVLYTIRDIGNLGVGSHGYRVNAGGQVVAVAHTVNGDAHLFRATASGQVVDLGLYGGGGTDAFAGINASGQVAATNTSGHAVRTTPTGGIGDPNADLGSFTGAAGTSTGVGINTSGQVTGYSTTATGSIHAFRMTATGLVSDPGTDLGTLGGSNSYGFAINDSGQVTGRAYYADNTTYHAFRTTANGSVGNPGADLGTLGGALSEGRAINNSGQVTGDSRMANGAIHAFRTTANGVVSDPGTDLGVLPGYASSFGWDINSLGVVVGYSQDASSNPHAFVYDTQMHDLNDLIPPSSGWVLSAAYGINDSGQITGYGSFNGNPNEGYVLTPISVPEPPVSAYVAVAVACGWVVHSRRRFCSSERTLTC